MAGVSKSNLAPVVLGESDFQERRHRDIAWGVLAASRLSCALLRQTARDLTLDITRRPNMTKSQMARLRAKIQSRADAENWIHNNSGPISDGGIFEFGLTLEECCYHISHALSLEGGHQITIPHELVRQLLITAPSKVLSMLPDKMTDVDELADPQVDMENE